MTVPPVRCAEMIYDFDLTKRAFLHAKEEHRREVRKATIKTLIGIFCCRAIEAERDEIWLFDPYKFL